MEEAYDPDNPGLNLEQSPQTTVHRNLKRTLHGWRSNQPLPEYGALVDKLTEYFKLHGFEASNELEIRLGKLHTRPRHFEPGVSGNMFTKILETLRSCDTWEDESISKHTDYFHNDRRLRIHEDGTNPPELVSKRALVSLDVMAMGSPFDFRFSCCKEKAIEATQEEVAEILEKAKLVRHKERMSFAYKFWVFDLTIVRTEGSLPGPDSEDCFDDTLEGRYDGRVFEVELEVRNVVPKLAKTTHNAFYLADSTLIKLFDIMNFVEEVDVQKLSFNPMSKSGKS